MGSGYERQLSQKVTGTNIFGYNNCWVTLENELDPATPDFIRSIIQPCFLVENNNIFRFVGFPSLRKQPSFFAPGPSGVSRE